MRKFFHLFSLFAAVTLAFPAFAGSLPGTGIYQSVHDLTNGPDGSGTPLSVVGFVSDSQQRMCAYCHTPHHAIVPGNPDYSGADFLPLWSHQVSNISYSPYASQTFTLQGGLSMAADPLTGPSRLCMSCHDGITAVDNYYGIFNNDVMTPLPIAPFTAQPVISSNGSSNHPIGFVMTDVIPGYPSASHPDTNILPLNDNSTYNTGTAYSGTTIISRLFANLVMTCSSCHDVHNTLNKVSYQAGESNYLLLGSRASSGLCLSCHTLSSGDIGNAHNW